MKALADDGLPARSPPSWKEEVQQKGRPLDELMPEAFALVREAGVRALGHAPLRRAAHRRRGPAPGQHRRDEDRRGQDARRDAARAYLNALAGRGVHVVTVNDYLARRDAEWMGRLYRFLGLSTGVIVHGLTDTRAAGGLPRRHHLRAEQRVRLRLPARQHEVPPAGLRPARAQLRDRRRGRLDPHRRGAHAAHHLAARPTSRPTSTTGSNQVIPATDPGPGLHASTRRAGRSSLTDAGVEKMEKQLGVQNLYDPERDRDAPPRRAGAARAHALQARRATTS